MPNVFKNSDSNLSNSIRKGNINFGINTIGYGPTSSTGYWMGIDPPIGGYTVYVNTQSGIKIYCPSNDSNLILAMNSTIAPPTVNLVTNPTISANINNYSLGQYPYGSYGPNDGIFYDSTIPGLKVVHETGYSNSQTWANASFTTPTVGLTYTVSVDCKTSVAGSAYLNIWTGSGWAASLHTGDGTWQKLVITFQCTGVINVRLAHYSYAGTSWFKNLQLEQKSNSTPFVDGTRNAFSTVSDVVSLVSGQSDITILNRSYGNIVTDGLVLYLDPSMINSYPNAGSTLYDLSPSGKNHTITNSPTYSTLPNRRFTLNGVQGFTYTSSLTTSTTCTVVIFTKTSDTQYLWVMGNNSGGYYLSADYGGGYYHGSCGNPTNYVDTVQSSYQPHDDVWHMLEAKNVDFSGWTRFDWFLYPPDWGMVGDVSLILVYNKNLSSTESSQNYEALKEINARNITSSDVYSISLTNSTIDAGNTGDYGYGGTYQLKINHNITGCNSSGFDLILKDDVSWSHISFELTMTGTASCWSFNGGRFGSSANNIYTYDETLGDMVYNCLNSWEKPQFQSHNKQSACDNDSNNFFHGAYSTGDPKIFFMKRRRNVNGSRAGIGHGRACMSLGTTIVSNIKVW